MHRSFLLGVIIGTPIAAGAVVGPARAEPPTEHADIASPSAVAGEARWETNESNAPDPLLETCPMAGPSTFEDSWGWARSGGRRHEGVDMIADRGTPVVAVRDGLVEFTTNGLGGRAIWLTAANGDQFYYAHLDDWNGDSRAVEVGEVIGYVGSSGNAGGPHLHFETLPGGDVENPYPATLGACVPTLEQLAVGSNRPSAVVSPPTALTPLTPPT